MADRTLDIPVAVRPLQIHGRLNYLISIHQLLGLKDQHSDNRSIGEFV